ncbi:hypothetical protein KOEU_39040 [Komagataeibacter europaeus]|uniref:Uncharacterized protein n=1 Tax=Komagataeibacter europaeus TaxID=33995 RepID=A0A0M0EBF0_KOMEU|nr:hypothetical protein KOEU_39040 [Komagataeibacter europaeus]
MPKNAPYGDNRRIGMVQERSQAFNPITKQWVKRNSNTGHFMDVKQDGTPFKGVRKEK